MDPAEWEQVGSIHDSENNGVMVSNLPLLFANSEPSSLQNMTQRQLERFVAFMVRCSLGEDMQKSWNKLPRPVWWPNRLLFKLPTGNAPTPSHRSMLQRLVERCYQYHGCEFLLQFCRQLVQQKPPGGYKFTDNRDGTTSMHHSQNGKLLVTFRNENREYDKQFTAAGQSSSSKMTSSSSSSSSRPQLLPRRPSASMVNPAPVHDVYLCDRCDQEFANLHDVQTHERECAGFPADEANIEPPRPPSPEPEILDVPLHDPTDQVTHMYQLGLFARKAGSTTIAPPFSPTKSSIHTTGKSVSRVASPIGYSVRKVSRSSANYFKCDSVDVSSPLGRVLRDSYIRRDGRGAPLSGNTFSAMSAQQSITRYERHLPATPDVMFPQIRDTSRGLTRWVIVYRDPRLPWYHSYSFTKLQRSDRWLTIETGLVPKSRELYAQCKPCRIKLKRVPKRVVDKLTLRGQNLDPMCIDLTSEEGARVPALPGIYNNRAFNPSSTSSKSNIVENMLNFFRGKCQWTLAPGFLEHVIAGGAVPDNPIATKFQQLFSPSGVLVTLLGSAIRNCKWAEKALMEYGTLKLSLEQHNCLLVKLGILNEVAIKFGASAPMTDLVMNFNHILSNPQEMIRLTSLPPNIQRRTNPNAFFNQESPKLKQSSGSSASERKITKEYGALPSSSGPIRYKPGPKCRTRPDRLTQLPSSTQVLRKQRSSNDAVLLPSDKKIIPINFMQQKLATQELNKNLKNMIRQNLDATENVPALSNPLKPTTTAKTTSHRAASNAAPIVPTASGVDINGIPVIDVIDLSSDEEEDKKQSLKNSVRSGNIVSSLSRSSKTSVNNVQNSSNNSLLGNTSIGINQQTNRQASGSRDNVNRLAKEGSSSYSTNCTYNNYLGNSDNRVRTENNVASNGVESQRFSNDRQSNSHPLYQSNSATMSTHCSKNEHSHWSQTRSYGLGRKPERYPVANGYDSVQSSDYLNIDSDVKASTRRRVGKYNKESGSTRSPVTSVHVTSRKEESFDDCTTLVDNFSIDPTMALVKTSLVPIEIAPYLTNNNYLSRSPSKPCTRDSTKTLDKRKASKRIICGYDSEYEIEEIIHSARKKRKCSTAIDESNKYFHHEFCSSPNIVGETEKFSTDFVVSCEDFYVENNNNNGSDWNMNEVAVNCGHYNLTSDFCNYSEDVHNDSNYVIVDDEVSFRTPTRIIEKSHSGSNACKIACESYFEGTGSYCDDEPTGKLIEDYIIPSNDVLTDGNSFDLLGSVNSYLHKGLGFIKKIVSSALPESNKSASECSNESVTSISDIVASQSVPIQGASQMISSDCAMNCKKSFGTRELDSCLKDECKELPGVKELLDVSSNIDGRVTRRSVRHASQNTPEKEDRSVSPVNISPNSEINNRVLKLIIQPLSKNPLRDVRIQKSTTTLKKAEHAQQSSTNSDYIDVLSSSLGDIVAMNLTSGPVSDAIFSSIEVNSRNIVPSTSVVDKTPFTATIDSSGYGSSCKSYSKTSDGKSSTRPVNSSRKCVKSPSIMDSIKKRLSSNKSDSGDDESPLSWVKPAWVTDSACCDSPGSDSTTCGDSPLFNFSSRKLKPSNLVQRLPAEKSVNSKVQDEERARFRQEKCDNKFVADINRQKIKNTSDTGLKGKKLISKPNKSRMSFELRKLTSDECKEFKKYKFHPETIVQEYIKECDQKSSSDESSCVSSSASEDEQPVKNDKKSSLPKELKDLARDEFKEIKSSPLHPRFILKKFFSTSAKSNAPKKKSLKDVKKKVMKPVHINKRQVAVKSTRPVNKKYLPYLARNAVENSKKWHHDTVLDGDDTDVEDNADSDSSDESDNDTMSEAKPVSCSSPLAKKPTRISNELKRLMNDECKEFKQFGFHPGDIVNTVKLERTLSYQSTSSSDSEVTFNFIKEKPRKVDSGQNDERHLKEKTTVKKTTGSYELKSLFIDECKEFKKRRCTVSSVPRAHPYHSSRRTQYYNSNASLSSRLNPEAGLKKQQPTVLSCRSSRTQRGSNNSGVTKGSPQNKLVNSPRYLQRSIIQTEKAMCVLTYDLPNIT